MAVAEQSTEPVAAARGFILQASYRVKDGSPVVYLYGVLEGGGTFLVRDRRQVPHFHIRRSDAERGYLLGATRQFETAKQTFAGDPVLRVDIAVPQDTVPLRDRLHRDGVETFEADVRFAVRYLIDRDIRGGCEIVGAFEAGERIARVYDDPELRPADVALSPSVLSFDIETDPKARRLLAIAVYGRGVDEVYIVDGGDRQMPEAAIACADERAALGAFAERVREVDPDILTGWNVIDFDLNVLNRIAKRVRLPLDIGREAGAVRVRSAQGYFGSGQATIPGRLVLDGMDLVRGAFMRFDDYSLNGVAGEVLGEGKVEMGGGADRAADILARYRDDLETFAAYARTDARLALLIVERLDLVNLAIARSRLTGMTPDRVSASIASFDFRYLSALRKRRIVAPSVGSSDARVSRHQAGGHVFEPTTGIHENVWVFDFKSLYPSVIRTFNIDPLGYSANPGDEESVIRVAPDAAFRRDEAILPAMLDDLFPQREEAKRQGDTVASQAIKILMNSFYGVLGTPACRFHNVAIANAVTGMGRHFLQWSKAWFEDRGYDVLYGDTDSVFVRSGLDADAARSTGPRLAQELNEAIAAYTGDKWQVASRLEMEFEKLYLKIFLPSVRHGASGARKRYAGLVDGHTDVEFTGMEVVRRDWTELAKDVQRELYKRLFADEPVTDYLEQVAKALRSGKLDDKLVYRKGLRKRPAAYTANTPPHVAAARKSSDPGRVISYLITVSGPEPLDALHHEPDREHYLDKQVRPVAEPVLGALGLDFDRVIGDDRQMMLF
ncbi:MAG: DNA polymerase II [Gammaproteobacteria bacterium]|nr:DNA polymerase II [Gammaproteobacteria bacterium]